MSNKKEDYKYDDTAFGAGGPPDIDIDKLVDCSFSYSFDPLKKAIAYLLKSQNQGATNKRLADLEAKLRDYDRMADELKSLRQLRDTVSDHEERIEKFERDGVSSQGGKDTAAEIIDRIKELEYELKQLTERIKDLQGKLSELMKRKDAYTGSGGDPEDENDETKEIEEARKLLESELRNLKGRISQLEDKFKLLIMKLESVQKKEGFDLDDNDDIKDGSIDISNKHRLENQRTKALTNELDGLKRRIQELEDLIKKLKKLRSAPIAKEGVDYIMIIEELRDDMDRENGSLRDRLSKLEDSQAKTDFRSINSESRIDKIENDLKDMVSKVNNLLKDSKNSKSSIDDLDKKLSELKSKLNDKIDTSTFEDEIQNLKSILQSIGNNKNIDIKLPPSGPTMSQKDMSKFKELCEKMPELEKLLKDAIERIEITEHRLDAHDSQINNILKALNDKADKSVLDQINGLKATINDILRQLNQFDPIRADIESNRKRSDALEKTLLSLEDRMDFIKNSVNERLRELESLLKALQSDLLKLDSESNRQGGVIIQINQRIDTLQLKIDNLDRAVTSALFGSPGANVSSASQPDNSELTKQLAALKKDLITFKDEYYKRDKEIQDELAKKVDKADLIEFERLMRERMEALEKAIQKTKGELKKALRILDERIKKLTDQVHSRGPSLEREDAMFAKKPLEGWKCATCEKGLTNMIGLPADHYVWNRMPKKEGERIPMMGQGFSRMLMTLSHNNSTTNLENKHTRTFYTPREEADDEVSVHSSGGDKLRTSTSRLEKEGSTTLEGSMLPHIKKKSNTKQ